SVGGKVGVDHPLGKNLIGAFHQPAAVFIDPDTLTTLSEKEFRNGLAEVVKIAAALDRPFFDLLERKATQIRRKNPALIARIISRSVALKAAVVERDELESGLRKSLNLGHTIGHALEAASGYTLKHGEAIALGMIAEARIAVRLGLLTTKDYDRLRNLLRRLKLPTRIPSIRNKRKFFSSISTDKKSEGSVAKFVLLNGIGRSVIGVPVERTLIEQSLSEY
ncbi:MAG: 3-dehydroquinate synthase family protein, partial [bacterium]